MRVLRVLLIVCITAAAGLVLGAVVGDYITRALHVSEMEGGRGMMVIFICAPLGGLVGAAIGLVVSLLIRQPGAAGFFKAQGVSLLAACAIAGFLWGIFYLGMDKPPLIDGKHLTLDFELRLPASVKIPEQPDGHAIRVSLYETRNENRYGFIDWNSIVRQPDQITISGHSNLMAHSSDRSLLVSIGDESTAPQMFEVRIPPAPRKENEVWSQWITATKRGDLSPVPEPERFSLRYRVRELD
jgi:hypothetical protein